jgi:hypothetical protein
LLIPARLWLWLPGAAAIFPWALAAGIAAAPARPGGRLGWWLAHSLVVVTALFLAMQITGGLGFLILILPVFPVLFGLQAAAAGRQGHPLAFALSAALFLSWAVLAVFPLQ